MPRNNHVSWLSCATPVPSTSRFTQCSLFLQQTDYTMSQKSQGQQGSKKSTIVSKKTEKCYLLQCVTEQLLRAGVVHGGAPRRSSKKKEDKTVASLTNNGFNAQRDRDPNPPSPAVQPSISWQTCSPHQSEQTLLIWRCLSALKTH